MSRRKSNDRSSVGVKEVIQEIAKINSSKKRKCDVLVDYYWKVRRSSEETLDQVRQVNTYSDWINGIRNLLPSYIVLNCLADEAQSSSKKESDRCEMDRLSRFVDERKADILTSLRDPFWVIAYYDIKEVESQRSKLRAAAYYNVGRVVFPTFVYSSLARMIKSNEVDLSLLESFTRDTIRPGHKWFFDRIEKNQKSLEKRG